RVVIARGLAEEAAGRRGGDVGLQIAGGDVLVALELDLRQDRASFERLPGGRARGEQREGEERAGQGPGRYLGAAARAGGALPRHFRSVAATTDAGAPSPMRAPAGNRGTAVRRRGTRGRARSGGRPDRSAAETPGGASRGRPPS